MSDEGRHAEGPIPEADGAMRFAEAGADALPLHVAGPEALEGLPLDAAGRAWLEGTGYRAAAGKVLLLPGTDGRPAGAIVGLGPEDRRARGRFTAAAARAVLPSGTWRLATDHAPDARDEIALGWLLAGYRFGRYAKAEPPGAALEAPGGCDAARLEAIAEGERITRTLIDTPAADAGPAEIAAAAAALAARHGATCEVVEGDALAEGFPMIHAVGRAAAPDRAPRLVDIRSGRNGPAVTLVGKGVAFDTGGLNLKPAASMALMKKDMGGAATVLGLMHMIFATGAPVRLRVLTPLAENAVSGAAIRPGDVLTSRAGLTVEVNNTDAEGRLILADALAYAAEEAPDTLVSMATLTGAARVAVGADIAAYFTGDDDLARALDEAAARVRDPVWRLPFHDPYEEMIEPGIADLDNAPKGGLAGAITAALFLRRFAGDPARYTHFDVNAWTPSAAPARPKGGAGMGARALLEALPGLRAG